MSRKTKKQPPTKDAPEILIFDWKESAGNIFEDLKHALKKVGVVMGTFSLGTDDYIWSIGKRKATPEEIEKAFSDGSFHLQL